MATANDIFKFYCAKVFEVENVIEEDDILRVNFLPQLQSALLQVVDLQNSRNISRCAPLLNMADIPYIVCDMRETVPMDEDICRVVIPLYLAAEYYRDSGNYDLSGYFHDQFVAAVNERMVYNMEECESVV